MTATMREADREFTLTELSVRNRLQVGSTKILLSFSFYNRSKKNSASYNDNREACALVRTESALAVRHVQAFQFSGREIW